MLNIFWESHSFWRVRKPKKGEEGCPVCLREDEVIGMQPNRRRPLTSSDHRRNGIHPPLRIATSATTILFVALVFSTLFALYIGANRTKVAPIHIPTVQKGTLIDKIFDRVDSSSAVAATAVAAVIIGDEREITTINHRPSILSVKDLTDAELHPKAGPNRHIVNPPSDGTTPVTLVTCTTTVGYIHILVHPAWAPIGAAHFLDMVNTNYFSSTVALMRCIKGFLCQFGIAGIPSYNKRYRKNMKDDPNWLPEGPPGRKNDLGVKRFAKGYLAYAGGGPNTRGNQLIVALQDNERLGGGSPWEVPWGELVGVESFRTLDAIYTGYGEDGPSQGRLSKEGSSESIKKDFPLLDYVLGCDLIDSTTTL